MPVCDRVAQIFKVLEERSFPVSELIAVASDKSLGKSVVFNKQAITIVSTADALERAPNLALFSAGSDVSKEWAPRFVEKGTTVVSTSGKSTGANF